MFADREQRQLEPRAALELGLDAAQRIDAGDDHRAVLRLAVIVERDRLEPQHRRLEHLKSPGAQAGRGGLVAGLRTGDENGHALCFRRREYGSNG